VNALRPLALPASLAALLLLGGCSLFGSSSDEAQLKEDPSTVPVEVLYNRGVDALQAKRYSAAVTQFENVQQYYPYSTWAANAELMEGFAEYLQHKYDDAIASLDRFIQLHPAHRDIAYAYYLRALCYYEQIEDIRREQKSTMQALAALKEVVNRFPDSAYARDARLKIDLCNDRLAGKEMEIGRFYERQHLYAAALGRFQRVVDLYQTTNHVPEALHRLTEIYLLLGLPEEAKRTAAVLGHNYPGSPWYADSYDQLLADGQIKGAPGQPRAQSSRGLAARVWDWLF
jgi:outer membrane protein assembly factor BamD